MDQASQKIALIHKDAKQLIGANLEEEMVIATLCKNHTITKDYAALIIDNVLVDIRNKKDFWKLLIMGCFISISGFVISYISYNAAEENTTSGYIIFWGLVVTGIVMIFRAFTLYKK